MKSRRFGGLVHRNIQRGRIKGQLLYRRSPGPPPLKLPDMRCSEEALGTGTCFQAVHPLVGSLHRFGCVIVRAVVLPRRRSTLRPAARSLFSPSTPSRVPSPPSPGDDLSHQSHFSLAQQLRPFFPPICNWLEEDDLQMAKGLPISAGGFADLWRGSLDNRQVAIKAYRRYLSFDLSRVFLVCAHSPVS